LCGLLPPHPRDGARKGRSVAVVTSEGSSAGGGAPEVLVLPAIPVSAGALIFDRSGRLLILKPTYKSGWTIPGGVMEADGETPWQACRREVREECGIELRHGRLACMDFRRPRPGRPGGIRFLFDCGSVDDRYLAAITVQAEEISEHRLAALPDALPLLRRPIRRRVRAASSAQAVVYLEEGHRVAGVGKPRGSRIGGQAGTQDSRPYAHIKSKPRKQGRSTTHTLPADYGRKPP
jgi:8-oxo-dGTP diphosphatase